MTGDTLSKNTGGIWSNWNSLLSRWFVGLSVNEPVWHPTVFTKNRDRLLEGAVAEEFFSLIVGQARSRKLLSDEHFTVDGILIEAWAGQKSFQRKGSGPRHAESAARGSQQQSEGELAQREAHESNT